MTGPADGFGLDHLPYGSVRRRDGSRFAAVRFGEHVLDLAEVDDGLFTDGSLDAFLAAGRPTWQQIRAAVRERLEREPELVPLGEVTPVLAFTVADYVDFYASEHHATNVGSIFRPGGAPLTPNWKHLPIGYHGRSGTVVVSGTDIRRPSGQYRDADGQIRFGRSQKLDIEAEVGFVVGGPSEPGLAVSVDDADEHVFGVCLVNDWSARDLQAWEGQPLGPFLAKSFATSVAAWITPLDALEAARTWPSHAPDDPEPVRYLRDTEQPHGLYLDLTVSLNGQLISSPPFAEMYWTYAQMLAHMTVNGAHLRTGDLFASGTVSGPDRGQRGCLLELTWNGTEPLTLPDGSQRRFLEDGDEVVIRATAPGPSGRIELAEVAGRIGRKAGTPDDR